MKKDHSGAFGRYIRAARLGYHEVAAMQAWVKFLIHDDRTIEARIVPTSQLIPAHFEKKRHEKHVVWWEGDPKGEKLLSLSPALQRLGVPDKPVILRLGNDGEDATKSTTSGG